MTNKRTRERPPPTRPAAKYFGLWHGGSSYAAPDPLRDGECFDSIAHAGRTLQSREDNDDGRTPCSEGGSIELYAGGEYHDNGPDLILTIGPRGGVRREN